MSPSALAAAATEPSPALRAAFAAPLLPAAVAAAASRPGERAAVIEASAIEVVLETGSTNGDLLALARSRAPSAPRLRVAQHQTAGRGRLGRRWHAAPGSALLFSLAVPLGGRTAPPFATLVAGVAVAESMALHDVDLKLKWPNDLLLDGRKLGGVLAELALDRVGGRTLVLGVGINLWLDPAARGSIDQPAAALAERMPLEELLARREALIGAAAAAVLEAVLDCSARGFVPYQPRFMRRFPLVGQPAEIVEQGACIASGRILGVDGEGRLLLEHSGGVTPFATGEVSIRAGAPGTPAPTGDGRQQRPVSGGVR